MIRKTILGLAALAALAALVATPAAAQNISRADWEVFLEGSYSGLSIPDDAPDWEDALYRAAQDRSQAEALRVFARDIGVPQEQALRYAEVIVATVQARECPGLEACGPLEPGDPRFERIMAPALEEPTGELLWVVGSNLGTDMGPMGAGVFVNAIRDHPARLRVISRLHDYSEEDVFLLALILESPRDSAALRALGRVRVDPNGEPDGWNGWRLAALESAAARARAEGATPREQALYAQVVLAQYFGLGLTEQGLSLWDDTPADMRALLPLPVSACNANDDEGRAVCSLRASGEALADELAAALWLRGEEAQARAWIAQAESRLGASDQWSRRSAHLALLDAMERTRPAEALFPLLTRGEEPPPGRDDDGGMEEGGWAFIRYAPAARVLVTDRVRDAGYAQIAAAMEREPTYFRSEYGRDDLARMAEMLEPVAGRRAELAAGIDEVWDPGVGQRRSLREARIDAPLGWTETRLPAGVASWSPRPADNDEERGPIRRPAGATEPPVPSYAVLRHDVIDREQLVLFASAEYDLPGELPAPGVWMVRTEGGEWTAPVYLGLRQHFPYVVAPASAVPLLQDGRLRIEVAAREIDPASITFPPVALRLKREEAGLVIERELSDVLRDTDGDGMTDIAERRLGLDPAAADTDGDGRPDGSDAVPLTPWSDSVPPARAALARTILQRLTGHGDGAIVVPADLPGELDEDLLAMMGGEPAPPRPETILMVGDPEIFASMDLPFQLIVYTPEQMAQVSEGQPPSFPPEVTVYSSLDGLEHLVVWSATWTGGRFFLKCPADGAECAVEDLGQWIT